MNKEQMQPQQEEPYPLDFYINEIKQQSEYIASILSENQRQSEEIERLNTLVSELEKEKRHVIVECDMLAGKINVERHQVEALQQKNKSLEEALNYIDELLAGIEDVAQVDRWMPIETCPTGHDHPYADFAPHDVADPAQFVLFTNGLHVGVGYAMIDDMDEDEVIRYCDEHNEYIDKPTHWQPLPSLPVKQ